MAEVINERYELDEHPTGQGAMGDVWFGRDTKLDRPIAVKFLVPINNVPFSELIRRFRREARITARLEHPGVPAVYDVGTSGDRPYLVMQRIHGRTIANVLHEHQPFSVAWSCSIAAQVCAVLSAAHRSSLVHRDLKPANLMLCSDGTLKVLDFGLAVGLELADFSRITHSGQELGTPAYKSPEQALGGSIGPQADLYSLGCILFEMLTGRQPFVGTNSFSLQSQHVNASPPHLRDRCPQAPTELGELLHQLLAKSANSRPRDADETFERLLPFVDSPSVPLDELALSTDPDPIRMYATAVARTYSAAGGPAELVTATKESTPASPADISTAPATPAPPFGREGIALAREEADDLVLEARYTRAIEVLEAAVRRATTTFGPTDRQVLALRLEHANAVYEGGEPRRAAELYAVLAEDYAERDGPDDLVVFQCREREARCRIQLGESARALELLRALATDRRQAFDPRNTGLFELRRQIGRLEIGQGQFTEARETLQALHADAVRAFGDQHAVAVDIRETLEGLSGTDPSN